jgi:hypothetical protein
MGTADMNSITIDQALARLRTWTSEPSEDTRDSLVAATLSFTSGIGSREALDDAAAKYRAEQREMAYEASGFGCDIDADTARQDIREATEIIDLNGDHDLDPLGVAMMKARGCYIAGRVPRLGGKWVGFGSKKAVDGAPE